MFCDCCFTTSTTTPSDYTLHRPSVLAKRVGSYSFPLMDIPRCGPTLVRPEFSCCDLPPKFRCPVPLPSARCGSQICADIPLNGPLWYLRRRHSVEDLAHRILSWCKKDRSSKSCDTCDCILLLSVERFPWGYLQNGRWSRMAQPSSRVETHQCFDLERPWAMVDLADLRWALRAEMNSRTRLWVASRYAN
jgi:hypothetical protein